MKRIIYKNTCTIIAGAIFITAATGCTGRTAPAEAPAPEATEGVKVIPTPVPNAKSDR